MSILLQCRPHHKLQHPAFQSCISVAFFCNTLSTSVAALLKLDIHIEAWLGYGIDNTRVS